MPLLLGLGNCAKRGLTVSGKITDSKGVTFENDIKDIMLLSVFLTFMDVYLKTIIAIYSTKRHDLVMISQISSHLL